MRGDERADDSVRASIERAGVYRAVRCSCRAVAEAVSWSKSKRRGFLFPHPISRPPSRLRCMAGNYAQTFKFTPLNATLETVSAHLYADERIVLSQDGLGLYDG